MLRGPPRRRPRFEYIIGTHSFNSLNAASDWLRGWLDNHPAGGAPVKQKDIDEWMAAFIRGHPNTNKLDGWTGRVIMREQTVKGGHVIHVPLLIKTIRGTCVEEDISFMKKCLLGCRRPV